MRPTQAKIDLLALQHNFKQVKKFAPQSNIVAMVKANAYGHGLVTIAKHLSNADLLGVACIDEAEILINHEIKQPIILMEGIYNKSELSFIQKHKLQMVLHEQWQVSALLQNPQFGPYDVWLKINTGMNRLGFSISDVPSVLQQLQSPIINSITLITHFADADNPQKLLFKQQIHSFVELTSAMNYRKSMANSAAIIGSPQTHFDFVRPGLMLYGISPFADKTNSDHNLKPVMTLSSELIAIHDLKAGEAIGYGGRYQCSTPHKIGVVAIGYGDGYPRHAKNGTPVLIKNQIVPLVGNVSMDMITIDLSNIADPQIGDEVILWGEKLPVEVIAEHANTISYELVSKLTQRVPRISLSKL